VGVLDAGGSAFDSEVWADADMVNQAYQRPKGLFQSATARLVSPESFASFKKTLEADPRLTVQVESEVEYYAKASRMITTLIAGSAA
jgi:putative ABC transport system permease protein